MQAFGHNTGIVSGLSPSSGRILYPGANGKLAPTRPTPPSYAQPFAALVSSSEIFIEPDWPSFYAAQPTAGGWV
jgi:hypothetical protein